MALRDVLTGGVGSEVETLGKGTVRLIRAIMTVLGAVTAESLRDTLETREAGELIQPAGETSLLV